MRDLLQGWRQDSIAKLDRQYNRGQWRPKTRPCQCHTKAPKFRNRMTTGVRIYQAILMTTVAGFPASAVIMSSRRQEPFRQCTTPIPILINGETSGQ